MTTIQLPIMTLKDSLYRSPKRKRGDFDSDTELVTAGFRHGFDQAFADRNDAASPSIKVTGKFEKLVLQSPVEQSPLWQETTANSGEAVDEAPQTSSLDPSGTHQQSGAVLPQSSQFTFEAPTAVSSTWTQGTRRSKSPPPSQSFTIPDQFWRESEITGYSPDDPDEDDYGVNGVGYQKTPAVAYAISQKRKQQIADYRSRETREARQRRGERRMKSRHSTSPQRICSLHSAKKDNEKLSRAVHFADS